MLLLLLLLLFLLLLLLLLLLSLLLLLLLLLLFNNELHSTSKTSWIQQHTCYSCVYNGSIAVVSKPYCKIIGKSNKLDLLKHSFSQKNTNAGRVCT